MIAERHARAPWVVWAAAMLLLAVTLTMVAVNRSLDDDPLFVPLAVAVVTGYSTVGAVVASRNPRNVLGWLMMGIALAFVTTGVTSEYVSYALETSDRALPFAGAAGLVSEVLWLPMLSAVGLLVALYPTGRVPTRRWRFLPPAFVALLVLFLVGEALTSRSLVTELGTVVPNPFGVEELEPVAQAAGAVGGFGLLLAAPLCVVALALRYRRSSGEERQQIRWLAYIAVIVAAVVVFGITSNLVVGHGVFEDVLFYVTFTLIGIGVPVAMGVAILKFRLYDLDLVVKKTVLYVTLAALLTGVFVVVAVIIGAIAGRTDTGAIVAAAAIGVSFWPALRLARRIADRIVYGRRATPYEVLAEFSTRVAGSYGAEDVLPRMAQVLRDAVGASHATVWLHVGHELRPAAMSPSADVPETIRLRGDELPALGADASAEVRDRGDLLGALTVTMPPNDRMNPSRERLVRDLASQAGLVLRNVRLIEELRASRQRIVTAQDERARKLERDLHDGAQQQLVALAVKLRLAEQLAEDPAKARAMIAGVRADATEALETLRDLARGIYPPLLADEGLAVALESQGRKSPVPLTVDVDGIGRYAREVETAVYFASLEALQNVAKYANAQHVSLSLSERDGVLNFAVEDDGIGFEPEKARGSGITNMRDRLEAVGGDLTIRSAPGRGTVVQGRIAIRESVA